MATIEKFSYRYKVIVLASITLARIIYSINWFTLSPGLYQVHETFNATLTNLGVLESAFLVGAGIFQVPSSYAAARWNAKLLVVSGLGLITLANGAASFAPNFEFLIAMRFLLGVGAAMFFSPAIIVVAPMFRNERQGIALGIYNSAFSIGGTIGLFGWSYLVQLYNWRIGLLFGAILALIALVQVQLIIRHTDRNEEEKNNPEKSLVGVLRDKQIWMIGIGILGMWSGYYALTQFIPFYETSANGIAPDVAAFMASLVSIVPIPGALIGGWASDKLRNRKAFLVYPTVIFGISVMLIGYAGFAESITLLVILGLMDSFAFTAMYAAPFQMEHLNMDQKAIAISLMNGTQIVGAFVLPILFTIVATAHDYQMAWLVAGVFGIVFVPLLIFMKEPFKQDS